MMIESDTFFQSGKLFSDWMTSCWFSALCAVYFWLLRFLATILQEWLFMLAMGDLQLQVLEPSSSETLDWIFLHKIQTKPMSVVVIKYPQISPLCCCAIATRTGSQFIGHIQMITLKKGNQFAKLLVVPFLQIICQSSAKNHVRSSSSRMNGC